jgi:hypothetical protein
MELSFPIYIRKALNAQLNIENRRKICYQTDKMESGESVRWEEGVESDKKISLTGGFEPPTFRLTAERSTD